MKRTVVVVSLLIGLPFGLRAQVPQSPTLRASVDQVVVDVVVTDAAGQPVTGLTAADFELFDRGEPQAIATFTEVVLPIPPARAEDAPIPVPSDVRSNVPEDGRIFVIVFDDWHVAISRTPIVQQLARQLLARYTTPTDLVAVMTASGVGDTSREPTTDLRSVDAAITRFAGQGMDIATGASIRRAEQARRDRNEDPMKVRRTSTTLMVDGSVDERDPDGLEERERMSLTLRSLSNVAEGLRSIPGRRKTLLFFSEGLPITPRDGEMAAERGQMLAAAARANVTIHAIDPRGLDHSVQGATTGLETQIRLMRMRSLEDIAEGTGGTVTADTNNLEPGLRRIVSESSRHYLLAYSPPDAGRDGRYRKIEVKVNTPGLRVSARRGYTEPDDKAERRAAAKLAAHTPPGADIAATGPLAALLERATGTRGLLMTAQALAFPASQGNVSVVLELGGGALAFDAEGDRQATRVDLAILPISRAGRTLPRVDAHLPLALDAADAAQVRERGIRVVQGLSLPPGDYQLRIAAREAARGTTGSVVCEVSVPDPARRGIAVSGLVVSSSSAGQVPSASRDERLEKGLGGRPPTTARAFGRGDTLSVYAEVVDATASTSRDVTLVTILRDERGREVVNSPQPRANARVAPGQAFAYATDVPLRSLAPGRYVLRVDARVEGTREAASREIPFDVQESM